MKIKIKEWKSDDKLKRFYYVSIETGKNSQCEWYHQIAQLLSITKEELLIKVYKYKGRLCTLIMTNKDDDKIFFSYEKAMFGFEHKKNAQSFIDDVITPNLLLQVLCDEIKE